ncbi:MAG: lipopolysaccharide heptosyltransferase II [bacterium]|nr:lipopolysaccharide heptosyltransferase II [bacterium]
MDKILIIQTAFLGDVILTTPLIRALYEGLNKPEITLITTPQGREILTANPYLSEIIPYDKKKSMKGPAGFLKIAGQVRRREFDLAVLPHRSLRSASLAYLGKISQRIGFDTSTGSFLLTEKVIYQRGLHEVERNLELAGKLGITGGKWRPELFVSEQTEEKAAQFFLQEGLGQAKLIVGLNPGSIWATKRWLPEGFARVGDVVAERFGGQVILFGAPEDITLVNQIAGAMKNKPVIAAGKTGLADLASFFRRCHLFITNDSGPMHIAAAVSTPVVGIFGATTPSLGFYPYSPHSVVVEIKDLACRPCGSHGGKRCPDKSFACMREITPEQVVSAVEKLLLNFCHRKF